MIHYLQIRDSVVVNRIVAEEPLPPDWFGEGETWVQNDDAGIGWLFDGKTFAEPPRIVVTDTDSIPVVPDRIAILESRLAKLEQAAKV